jgi:glycosyltransferase involved in cell wall biosynthesis
MKNKDFHQKKLKIVNVVPYYPPHLGGGDNVAKEISEGLTKRGHEVIVLTSDIGCENNKLKSKTNITLKYLKAFEIGHAPIIPTLFYKLLRINKSSIMYINAGHFYIPEIVMLVSKIKKIPYVIHYHVDVGKSGKLGFLLPLYKKLFLKSVLINASRIICLTNSQKIFLCKQYGLEKNRIVVIPNGIGKEYFVRRKILKNNSINVLFVGRLSVEKNIPRLIRAVSLLKNKITLHIVGEGEKKEEIEKLISITKLNNVILHGKKTGNDLINMYKSSDIFVLTSDNEGIPLVLLESMATGLPIVASDIDGVKDLVGDTGILVNPLTAENFATQIDKLITNYPVRRKLSKKGVEKARTCLWSIRVKQLEQVYREVLKEHERN